ncbi:MAG: hypothetical protein A2X86_16100 [Bdellovibrionales bacterium GWA2_49_15]|nr:MAG: hypothetical protein A2X86_16100 [Bdellovibrionales bacterium GWA2_49_15]HAZ13207.1 hypothetical protein [Bdellovibrionales bacterium]
MIGQNILLNLFMSVHGLIFLAALLSLGLRLANHRKMMVFKARHELRLNHLLLVSIFLLPILTVMLSSNYKIDPIAKSYTAVTYKEYDSHHADGPLEKIIIGSDEEDPQFLSVEWLKLSALALLFISILCSLYKLVREFKLLASVLKNSYPARSFGKVRITFSEQIKVPFSLMTLRHAWIVLPSSFMFNSSKMKISILHEIQHHRQSDTRWLFVIQLMKALTAVNPAVHVWIKIISELQELKVDENLIDQEKIGPREYARCLIEVAESVAKGEKQLVCAAGLAFLPDRHLLTRRIEFMFRKNVSRTFVFIIVTLFLVSTMSAFALTTGNVIGARAITMAEAKKMVRETNSQSEFPIIVNEQVLEQLNRYIGTVQGKEAMRKALRRMENYRSIVEGRLKNYNLPGELMAIPIIESAYQNLPESQNPFFAAGIWQFIRSTAKNYGLRVDTVMDERLDPELATDAALRYLSANQARFRDWHLAVLAYNMGERNVQKAIDQHGSRNAWELVRAGYEGDKNYLPKIMAAVLIMKNPSIVK